jgi:hypothetical protein
VSRSIRSLPRRSLAAGLLLVLALLGGCSKHHGVTAPPATRAQPPTPSSPEAVVRLLEWSWNHRDTLGIYQLLADDFRFQFARGDSAGNPFRDQPLGRDEMLCMVRHLFVGGGTRPPATSIVLNFDPTLYPQADSRPGKNPRWHREIVTGVYLITRTDEEGWDIQGSARFFVVRGDSAAIPPELAARGFRPDSTRWYLEQWNDETMSRRGSRALPAGALPSKNITWGQVLCLYR